MTGPLIRMCVLRRPASSEYPALWWIGVCPWPSLPTSEIGAFSFWCCPEDGVMLKVFHIEVHMPRNPGDPVATVRLQRYDEDGVDHLMQAHGFRPGLIVRSPTC